MAKSAEDDLKRLHLARVSHALLDSSPSLSTWLALSAIADQSGSQPAFQAHARPLRLMWCASCRASCRLRVQPKRHRISVTCLRPDCRKHVFLPLASRQTRPNPSAESEHAHAMIPVATPSATSPAPPLPSAAAPALDHSPKPSTSEESKAKRVRSKARASRPGLADLLARRKADQATKDSQTQAAATGKGPGSLQSFLTQL